MLGLLTMGTARKALSLTLASAFLAAALTVVPVSDNVPLIGGTDERASAQCFLPANWMCEGEPAREAADLTAQAVTWVTVRFWVVTCHPVTGGGLAAAGLAKSAAGAARVAANVGYSGAAVALVCTGRWVWQTVRG